MRKKQAATAMLLALTLAVGCAPGRISEYTAKAQRAGEAMFGDAAADVLAEGTAEMEGAEAAEGGAETESAEGADGRAETEIVEAAETEIAETAEGTAEAAEGRAETESAEAAEDRETAENAALPAPATRPALLSEVPEELSALMDQKGADFTGKLAGKDGLFWTEEKALEAVLSQESYGDKTLCIQNMARYDGKEKGSFLLMFESAPLTARQRVQGDLWYFDGERASRLAEDTVFTGAELVTGDAAPYLIVRMQEGKREKAAVYTVTENGVQASFADAVSIQAADGTIRVDYPAEAFRYDPLVGEWEDGDGTVPYFYERTADGFAPLIWKELSAQEYVAYARGAKEDAEAGAYEKELEEKFYTGSGDGSEYHYEFFAVGDGRIGFRQRRIGKASENGGEIGHSVAEYIWQISELDGGKLKKDGVSLGGEGYYFENRAEREEELESLNEIPAEYQARQIGQARRTMRAAEKKALELVLAAQEYPEDALCFVSAADFDGDGTKEAFVSVGGYDGAFGAPVCDLWYAGEEAQLLLEDVLFRSMEKAGTAGAPVQLVKGYEAGGTRDVLYTVKGGAPVRCLENMGSFAGDKDGGLLAWEAGKETSAPEYFHMEKGTAAPYGIEEIPLETILDYENGEAVYESILRQAGGDPVKVSCARRENGLIHVTFSDGEARFYDTYELQGGKLVLTDSGEGGYSPVRGQTQPEEAARKSEGSAAEAAQPEETAQAEETTETEAKSAETEKE